MGYKEIHSTRNHYYYISFAWLRAGRGKRQQYFISLLVRAEPLLYLSARRLKSQTQITQHSQLRNNMHRGHSLDEIWPVDFLWQQLTKRGGQGRKEISLWFPQLLHVYLSVILTAIFLPSRHSDTPAQQQQQSIFERVLSTPYSTRVWSSEQ
jgi:hypothetical protein